MQIDERLLARRAFQMLGLLDGRQIPSEADVDIVRAHIEDMLMPSRIALRLAIATGANTERVARAFGLACHEDSRPEAPENRPETPGAAGCAGQS